MKTLLPFSFKSSTLDHMVARCPKLVTDTISLTQTRIVIFKFSMKLSKGLKTDKRPIHPKDTKERAKDTKTLGKKDNLLKSQSV